MAYHPFRHLGLKFLSVGIALGLWFTVAGERTVERMLLVPLELMNPPDQLVMVESPPGSVEVRVRGASGRLSQLSPGAVVAMIDLSLAKEGRTLRPPDPQPGPGGGRYRGRGSEARERAAEVREVGVQVRAGGASR